MKAALEFSANEWTMTTLLIDADLLLFRTMAANEIEANLGDEVWVRWAELNGVRADWWDTIEEWKDHWKTTDYRLCWTGSSAFRKRIASDYKANRSSKPKPIGYGALKHELLTYSKTYGHDEIEADDWFNPGRGLPQGRRESIVVSGDKD